MSSSCFYAGDELGRIHAFCYSHNAPDTQITSQLALSPEVVGKEHAVQRLAVTRDAQPLVCTLYAGIARTTNAVAQLACARADGSITMYAAEEDKSLRLSSHYAHSKFAASSTRFVALDMVPGRNGAYFFFRRNPCLTLRLRGVLACTSAGKVTLAHPDADANNALSIASNLKDMRLSRDAKSFASGGDEVELSTWDMEAAFAAAGNTEAEPPTKKRKKDEVPNDNLNLRVPVHITSLCYAGLGSSATDIATGTSFGTIRRYDTRAKRRPAQDWHDVIPKNAAVRRVETGVSEQFSSAFETSCTIGGTVTSFTAPIVEPWRIFSSSMDRYVRIHSTAPPPTTAGRNLDARGETIAKLYTQDVMTAVCVDPVGVQTGSKGTQLADDEEVDDDIWDQLRGVEDNEDSSKTRKRRRI
ncbi:hypothetical protein BKA62DRAFT_670035 [Auriculariales sp. MPI-PUGE-AT-0066]|nr:hypothetical protein BKA62DRAFT_670035 [Auriculariales sp. MPI-PUGE-AT-0066]